MGWEAGETAAAGDFICGLGAVCIEIRLMVIFCLFSMGNLAGVGAGAGDGTETGCLVTLVMVVFEESRCMAA